MTPEGPFFITCDDDKIFLKVSQDNEVTGIEVTGKNPTGASEFFIVPTYNSKHPHEFAIAFYSKKKFPDVNPVPRYLDVSTNVMGCNCGPLRMEFGIKEHNCRLTLRNRLATSYTLGDITPWVVGREAFYIKCARRILRFNGYICVKRQEEDGSRSYITECVRSVKKHDEHSGLFMVFRLVPAHHFNTTDDSQ